MLGQHAGLATQANLLEQACPITFEVRRGRFGLLYRSAFMFIRAWRGFGGRLTFPRRWRPILSYADWCRCKAGRGYKRRLRC
jgi:hypothetical protein